VKTPVKIAIVLALAGLVAAAVVLKKQDPPPVPALVAVSNKSLPKLLDLGATKCIPCKKMAPILQGLIGSGMGQGPALALLLAGPALSLQSMLVLRTIMGTEKTVVYVLLVVGLSTAAGMIYGALFGT